MKNNNHRKKNIRLTKELETKLVYKNMIRLWRSNYGKLIRQFENITSKR